MSKMSKNEGNKDTFRQFEETENIENQDSDFGEQGKMLIYSGEQGNRYAPGNAS